jgi:hypothetical protein
MRSVAVLAAMAVCLAGCGSGSSAVPLPPNPLEPPATPWPPEHHPSDRTKLLAQIDAAQAHWNVARPIRYQLTTSLRCFCGGQGVPLVSRVSGDTVVRSTGGRNWGPSLRTVDSVFAEVRRAASSDADDVKVEFDPRFGYPTRITIDEWREVFDDEHEWVVQLHVLP